MLETAVVIAGGEGSRLYPLTADKPKTLVEVAHKPLFYWVVRWLKANGIRKLVVGVAYKKEKMYEYLKENDNFGLEVKVSEHTVEGGTAQAFKLAISRHVKEDDFIAMNSDELTNMRLSHLVDVHLKYKPTATLCLSNFYCKFSVVETDRLNFASSFVYGKKLPDTYISNGIYVFNRRILDHIPDRGSMEDDVFKKLVTKNQIATYKMSDQEDWVSVNSVKDIKEANLKLKEWGYA